jgi:hypothetical protein
MMIDEWTDETAAANKQANMQSGGHEFKQKAIIDMCKVESEEGMSRCMSRSRR